jgi:hypothetical protein
LLSPLCIGAPFAATILLLIVSCGTVAGAELRTLRSAHYLVHTDLEQSLAEEMAQRLNAMYDEYARRLAQFTAANSDEKFEVYLFAKRDDYMRLTQNRFPNTGGIFMSGRNLLAAYLEGQGRDGLRRAIQHEAFHQFAFTAISQEMPIWLNEGMAQYFEEGIWTGAGFTFGQVPPRRLRQLQHDVGKKQLVPFRTMLAMTDEQWTKNLTTDAARGATQYNQAWAMTHFLIHAANGDSAYRPLLIKMLRRLHEGQGGSEAFVQSFSPNIEGFQDRFDEFAAGLEATPEATLIERQGVLADLLGESARAGQRYGDVREFRETVIAARTRVRYTKGQVQWQTSTDPTVYFSDLNNRLFDPNELYFDRRGQAPLPDLVCRGTGALRLRTRFYNADDRIEHEVLCELASQSR